MTSTSMPASKRCTTAGTDVIVLKHDNVPRKAGDHHAKVNPRGDDQPHNGAGHITPTSFGAMGWHTATCYPMASTGRAATPTTEPSIRTDRCDAESDTCSASNHQMGRKTFSRIHPWPLTPRRHLMRATSYRSISWEAFNVWRQETCLRCTA
jgi:hypothetical protein